ncbi:hypothetical protein F4777DRAFT_18248 [Nemania sp. FL0916]|nr:hypothetical protein F4777DRAFT_18248 [Nemania sp. FL0916]
MDMYNNSLSEYLPGAGQLYSLELLAIFKWRERFPLLYAAHGELKDLLLLQRDAREKLQNICTPHVKPDTPVLLQQIDLLLRRIACVEQETLQRAVLADRKEILSALFVARLKQVNSGRAGDVAKFLQKKFSLLQYAASLGRRELLLLQRAAQPRREDSFLPQPLHFRDQHLLLSEAYDLEQRERHLLLDDSYPFRAEDSDLPSSYLSTILRVLYSQPTDFNDTQAVKLAETIANETWQEKFAAQPFHTLSMVLWLMWTFKITPNSLWETPKSLKKFSVAEGQVDDIAMFWLISMGGRCTTFTIQVAEALTEAQRAGGLPKFQRFRWEFYSVGRHRLARCRNTGLVIHSSSLSGFITLKPGEILKIAGNHRSESLSYTDNDISGQKRDGTAEWTMSKGNMTEKQVMTICLRQLAKDASLQPLCYFRSATNSGDHLQVAYHGMIFFSLEERQIQLRRHSKDPNPIRFSWNMGANEHNADVRNFESDRDSAHKRDHQSQRVCSFKEHRDRYAIILARFIARYSGPNGAQQWMICRHMFNCFWAGACEIWGRPSVLSEGQDDPQQNDYEINPRIIKDCKVATEMNNSNPHWEFYKKIFSYGKEQ